MPAPAGSPWARYGSTCRRRRSRRTDRRCWPARTCTTPALAILSITLSETDDDAAPMITWVPAASSRSTVAFAVSVVVSPESPGISSDGLVEDATGSVDVVDCQAHRRDLRRTEECEAARLGKQGADLQRAGRRGRPGRGLFGFAVGVDSRGSRGTTALGRTTRGIVAVRATTRECECHSTENRSGADIGPFCHPTLLQSPVPPG